MADVKELQKQIDILEGQITMLTKQNKELRKFLPETPKCLVSIAYEDMLLNSIKNSKEFRECVNCFKEGSLKELKLSYNIDKLKKITSELERIEGVGYTKPIETNNSNPEVRGKVEKSMKTKNKINVRDNVQVEAYTYEE